MHQALIERRAFLVSDGVLNVLRPAVADAPRPGDQLVGRGTPRVWSFSEALGLMERVRRAPEALPVLWEDFSTGVELSYVYYHVALDSFRQEYRSNPSSGRRGRLRLGHKRDYSHAAGEASYFPAPSDVSLDPPVVDARAIVESDLTRDDLVRLLKAVEALGQRAYESWNVGSIIETLARWLLVRTVELREMKGHVVPFPRPRWLRIVQIELRVQ